MYCLAFLIWLGVSDDDRWVMRTLGGFFEGVLTRFPPKSNESIPAAAVSLPLSLRSLSAPMEKADEEAKAGEGAEDFALFRLLRGVGVDTGDA